MSETVAFDALIGNEALRRRLAADVREHKLSHAYIIEGPHGVGKRTLARELCAALACTGDKQGKLPCGGCNGCRKVREGNCPDVISVRRQGDKASIGVGDVRFLRPDVIMEPNDIDYKIYIIEEADLMTEEAQNALLLTLEEPPPYVLFLLLCTRSGALLETVRSRAALLRLCPLSRAQVQDYMVAHEKGFRELSAADQAQVLMIASGCIGRARELLNARERQPLLDRRERAAALAERFLTDRDTYRTLELFAPLHKQKREDVTAVLAECLTALRDLAVLKRSESAPLCFYTNREAACALCDRASMKLLLARCDALEEARLALGRGANVRQVLTALLMPL